MSDAARTAWAIRPEAPVPRGTWAPIRGSSGDTMTSYDAVMVLDGRTSTPPTWAADDPAFEARVLRTFIRDGRLVSIPASHRKRNVVYRHLLERIFPNGDEEVPERNVNMRLALWHPDVATIRRAFVDLGFVRRDQMVYRRTVPARSA